MRRSPIAGSWYPDDPTELREMVVAMLARAEADALAAQPRALIAPHAGIQFSGQAAACAFSTLQGRSIDRVVLLGPSHYQAFQGLAVSAVDGYETPLGVVPVDQDAAARLRRHPQCSGPADAEIPEHSLEMQLPFLQTVLGDFTLLPLVVGDVGADACRSIADVLRPFISDTTVVVASSDFTHYGRRFGYVPFHDEIRANLKRLDGGAIDLILQRDLVGLFAYVERTGATICGIRPIGILLALLPQTATGRMLAYYTSGDIMHDYTDVVSYAAIGFC